MFFLVFILGFKLHKKYELSRQTNNMQLGTLNQPEKITKSNFQKINNHKKIKTQTCGVYSSQIGSDYSWLYPSEILLECQNSEIVLRGIGIFRVKDSNVNKFPNGLIYINNANFISTMSQVYSSGVASSKVQLISLIGIGLHEFLGTEFKFCGVYPYSYAHQQGNSLPDDWDPSLIYISGESTNSFQSVTFIHPDAGSIQGWELRQTRPIKIEGNCLLNVTQSIFYNSSCYTRGSFLYLSTTKDTFISNCDFKECFSMTNEGHAVWITPESRAIKSFEGCNFTNCGKNYKGFVLESDVSGLIFSNNIIKFTNNNSSGCIHCVGKGKYTITNNFFSNAQNKKDFWTANVIHYDCSTNSYTEEEDLILNGNTFDSIIGHKEGLCIHASIEEGKFTVLENNIFKNNSQHNNLVQIYYRTAIQEFTIKGCKFENNTHNNPYGGGSGISINNVFDDSMSYVLPYTLVIQQSEFISNYCSQNGGGFQVGMGGDDKNEYQYKINVEIHLIDCNFCNNTSEQNGGAVSIQTFFPFVIDNCKFTENKSNNGGAIFIQTDVIDLSGKNKKMESVLITNCIFNGNSGSESHCIYILDAQNTSIEISSCNFTNDYNENYESGSCILSNSFKLSISKCNFTYEFSEVKFGSLIYMNETNDIEIFDCQFIKCYTSDSVIHLNKANVFTFSNNSISDVNRSIKLSNDVKTVLISNNTFERCISVDEGGAIYFSQTTNSVELFSLTNCEFEDCLGVNASCLLFTFLSDPEFVFNNNVIRYTKEIVNSKYLFSFCFKNKTDITIENVSFINVTSQSLYGGGTGIWITGVEAITFENCIFNNNTAIQLKNSEIRPNQQDKTSLYFNGDGGGFQYGYSESLYNTDIEIRNCSFMNNKASRHGGGIAFQTTKTVTIINCLFEGNEANNQNSEESGKSRLLFENYFDRKTEGRGGAIYFNPTFSHINKQDESFMTKVEIVNCTFKSNSAFDGCAIYIEGDDAGTEFIIEQNEFIDNIYSNSNPKSIRKGIITSEIFNLFDGKIETSNEFVITNPLMKEVLYVDHNGNIPTNEFSLSSVFTQSPKFTDILPLPTTFQLKRSEKLTQIKSISVTFTQMRSVSYSISYFESITNMISFNMVDSTFIFVETQTNFYGYFPYIIHYLSPLYVQTFVPMIISNKSKITKEKLIGISCGSACVFFLVLGIIILSIQKKNQDKLKYIEYDDISDSSEIATNDNNDDNEVETKKNNKITEQFDPNEEELESNLL